MKTKDKSKPARLAAYQGAFERLDAAQERNAREKISAAEQTRGIPAILFGRSWLMDLWNRKTEHDGREKVTGAELKTIPLIPAFPRRRRDRQSPLKPTHGKIYPTISDHIRP